MNIKNLLISNARSAWKFFSVQVSLLGGVLTSVYFMFYDKLKEVLPPNYLILVTCFVFIFTIVGRLINQTSNDGNQ